MSFADETDRRRKNDPQGAADPDEHPRGRKRREPKAELGNALRAAYRQAVEEDIPPEMLDLLGKLG